MFPTTLRFLQGCTIIAPEGGPVSRISDFQFDCLCISSGQKYLLQVWFLTDITVPFLKDYDKIVILDLQNVHILKWLFPNLFDFYALHMYWKH